MMPVFAGSSSSSSTSSHPLHAFVKHSRLESFLKRHVLFSNSRRTAGSKQSRTALDGERVLHYEGCVILHGSTPISPPFYAFLILTDRRLLLTELPPKKLKPLAELDRISDIVSVAEAPPTFLFDPHRQVAQRLRINYRYVATSAKSGSQKGKTWTASASGVNQLDIDSASKISSSNSSSDFSEVRTLESINSGVSSSSSSGESSFSNSTATTDVVSNAELIHRSVDVFLLLPSSDFGHIIYVTWLRRLSRPLGDFNGVAPMNAIEHDVDGSARYQWLLRLINHAKETNRYPQLHQMLRHWSSDCSHFASLIWQDSHVLDWLLSKLKQETPTPPTAIVTSDTSSISQEHQSEQTHQLDGSKSSNTSKALAAILDVANREVVWRILDSRYSDIVTCLTRAKKQKTISGEDCCQCVFSLLLLPCSIFSSKAVELLLLSEWVVIVACIAKRLITIIRRSHVSAEDCLALFKCLFVLRRLLQLDESRRVLRYLFKNHSDEFRYFGSAFQLGAKIFESTQLRSLIISMLTEIISSVLQFNNQRDDVNFSEI